MSDMQITTREEAHAALVERRRRAAVGAVVDRGIDLKRPASNVRVVPVIEQANDHVWRWYLHQHNTRWRKGPPVDLVIAVVSKRFGVGAREIRGESRKAPHVRARHVAMYVAWRGTGRSLPMVGRLFGGRDHTTVLNAVRKMTALEKAGELPELADVEAALRMRS